MTGVMHELSIAQSVVDLVQRHLPPDSSAPVTHVRMRVGALAGVVPDSLEFCFQAITSGTRIEGAQLVIEHVAVTASCAQCDARFTVVDHSYRCPRCGDAAITLLTGSELQVIEIELADT